jgi:hypothetical protein
MAKKTIIQKLKDKKAEVEADLSGALDRDLKWKAVAAILGGVGSDDWEEFMKAMIGEDSPEQLQRMMLKDQAKDDPDVRFNVAYVVSNTACTIVSRLRFAEDIDPVIDEGIVITP